MECLSSTVSHRILLEENAYTPLIHLRYHQALELIDLAYAIQLVDESWPNVKCLPACKMLIELGQAHVKLVRLVYVFDIYVILLVVLLIFVVLKHFGEDVALDPRIIKPFNPGVFPRVALHGPHIGAAVRVKCIEAIPSVIFFTELA